MGGDGRLSPLYDWGDPRFVDRVRELFRKTVKVEELDSMSPSLMGSPNS
jgi:hypothetical protein